MHRLSLMICAAVMATASPVLAQPADAPVLDADAGAALNQLGASLRRLKTFEVTAESRLERAFERGPNLEYRLDTRYLVQMPDRMLVDIQSDQAHRRAIYDGKTITVQGMATGQYVSLPMQGSISEVLTRAYNNLGLDFPLQDLFRWGSETATVDPPTEGFRVGESVIRGQKVSHFAYRMPDVDFQIWMSQGEQPLPLRMVVTGRDSQRLRHTTDYTWNLKPAVTAASFTFKPRPGDQPITIEAAKSAATR
jgi:hypothetical protein